MIDPHLYHKLRAEADDERRLRNRFDLEFEIPDELYDRCGCWGNVIVSGTLDRWQGTADIEGVKVLALWGDEGEELATTAERVAAVKTWDWASMVEGRVDI